MDWTLLHTGSITQYEIHKSIADSEWQELRESLKGQSLEGKFYELQQWLNSHNHSRKAQVQVTNYINALKRGGLIK